MEDRTWADKHHTAARWTDAEMEALGRPSILLVEDDRDIRDLLETLLNIAGFQVEGCGTAEEALEHLRESPFDLVLTDYCLPHRSGGWLLKQASEEGLLDTTPALVVTAHPSPADAEGFEIIQKPFDLDELVGHVRRRLTGERPPQRKPRSASPAGRPSDDGAPDCPDPIELILYVSAQSPRSATAIANVKAVLSRFHSSRVSLTICDLSANPSGGKADAVAFTPTLVKRSPGPRTFIIGHLTNPSLLLELLEGCEES